MNTVSFLDSIVLILAEFGIEWTPFMNGVFIATVACFMLPFYLRSIRISRARKYLKRAQHLPFEERVALEQEAIDLVRSTPQALVGLAEQAIGIKRYLLADEILSELPNKPKWRRHAQRLQRKMGGKKSEADQQEQVIQELMDQGLFEAAKVKLLETSSALSPNQRSDLVYKIEQLELRSHSVRNNVH